MFTIASDPSAPKTRPKRSTAYLEALAMQKSLLEAATDPDVPAGYRAQCARAWECLEERKRILRGKPLPGQLRPDLQPKASKAFGRPRSISVLKPAQPVLAKPKPIDSATAEPVPTQQSIPLGPKPTEAAGT